MTTKGRLWKISLGTAACGLSLACGNDDGEEASNTTDVEAIADAARSTYAEIVEASYRDSLTAAQALDQSITTLVASPSQVNFDATRAAWLASREPYLETEVYRFYSGPIDNEETGPEGLMNAWPLDEAHIDYVDGDLTAGIINDTTVTIDATSLVSLNEENDQPTNVATGYHAIEFLLWGQDFNPTGPGQRPVTDYVVGTGGTADNQDRRGLYLATVSDILLSHLQDLSSAWSPNDASNYRGEFESVAPFEALTRILTGMTILSGFETGGERLQTALDSGEQEDEHSCFSDNSHRDFVQDVQGVLNVWQGSYTRLDNTTISGMGVRDVVEAMDQTLADELDARINQSLALANALVPPFDQEIATTNSAGQQRVMNLVDSLSEQESLLEDVFRLFALVVPPEPT